MFEFLITNWWIYIPIILVLIVLNIRTNHKVRLVKLKKAFEEPDPEKRQAKLNELKRKPSKTNKLSSRFGVAGLASYIFPRKDR